MLEKRFGDISGLRRLILCEKNRSPLKNGIRKGVRFCDDQKKKEKELQRESSKLWNVLNNWHNETLQLAKL